MVKDIGSYVDQIHCFPHFTHILSDLILFTTFLNYFTDLFLFCSCNDPFLLDLIHFTYIGSIIDWINYDLCGYGAAVELDLINQAGLFLDHGPVSLRTESPTPRTTCSSHPRPPCDPIPRSPLAYHIRSAVPS